MIKMIVFIHCDGWKNGGYENTLYFETIAQAESWLFDRSYCELISIEEITEQKFAEDYIGDL